MSTSLIEQIKSESTQINKPDESAAPRKAYAWARVSTEEQAEKDNSIPQQLKEIREYASRRGYEIVEEFSEAASAFQNSHKRVTFQRMIEKAKADPEIKAIFVHDFSRFSRDIVNGMGQIRELQQSGIQVFSVNDPDINPDTESGLIMSAFTFAKNEAYSRTLGMHVKKGSKANVHQRDPGTGYCYKNGGLPLWGYKLHHVQIGIGKGGLPSFKGIWILDETPVNGRPLYQWVRDCLLKAAEGASLESLRDFCNENGIPGRRDTVWNTSSWKDLLYDHMILKYAGYGIWNVRAKDNKRRAIDEWEIEPTAHPAIITDEEAEKIINARRNLRKKWPGFARAGKSDFILTGGVSICNRCGKNLIGYSNASGKYYVCGSQPYRGKHGCGPGVYVPKSLMETHLIDAVKRILDKCTDAQGFTKKVNAKLKRIFESNSGYDPTAEKRIKEIDRKVENLLCSIEDGIHDIKWVNDRIEQLQSEKVELTKHSKPRVQPIQIDAKIAMAHLTNLESTLQHGTPEERKLLLQKWVHKVILNPVERIVTMQLRLPEFIVNEAVPASHSPGSIKYFVAPASSRQFRLHLAGSVTGGVFPPWPVDDGRVARHSH